MNEIELRKAVIFIMWLRQAQPPGFGRLTSTSSATGEENYYKVTPRHSDSRNATPLKEGNFKYCVFGTVGMPVL